MKLGVVGLPNVGKSTLFNALTKAGAQNENYPFCTIEPNHGMVSVPDPRMDYLVDVYHPLRPVPATIEFVDIAGLVRGASKGEGLGNQFLSHIREVDAIIEVVRLFDDGDVTHVDGSIDPMRDVETINYELVFADIDTVERRLERAERMKKTGKKEHLLEIELCEQLLIELEKGTFARNVSVDKEKEKILRDMFLLTSKPIIYVANISEDQVGQKLPDLEPLYEYAKKQGSEVVEISAKVEEELASLSLEEKDLFIEELGIGESGLSKLIRKSYALLGLISYLTAGEKEVRAWTVSRGTRAPQAAGKIHTDFERGFIRAEVIAFDQLKELDGNIQTAKEKGKLRIEGKDYVMEDGDVVQFRFNV